MELLKKAGETYGSLKSFRFKGATVIASQSPMTQTRIEEPFEGDFVAPYKIRVEMKSPVLGVVLVSDGQTLWVYIPASYTYSRFALQQFTKPSPGEGGENPQEVLSALAGGAGLAVDVFQIYLQHGAKSAKILREEPVQLADEKVECYVVEAQYSDSTANGGAILSTRNYWIDKDRNLVLRESYTLHEGPGSFAGAADTQVSLNYTRADINIPIPDEVFTFVPPPGTKEGDSSKFEITAPTQPH